MNFESKCQFFKKMLLHNEWTLTWGFPGAIPWNLCGGLTQKKGNPNSGCWRAMQHTMMCTCPEFIPECKCSAEGWVILRDRFQRLQSSGIPPLGNVQHTTPKLRLCSLELASGYLCMFSLPIPSKLGLMQFWSFLFHISFAWTLVSYFDVLQTV